jgi:CheY-like chemotaxis protein
MVVDDARDSVEPLVHYLEWRGYFVRLFTDTREALAEIVRNPPQILLLDLLMPGMDGAMFLEAIRSALPVHSFPVVVLTGAPDSPLLQRVRGMNVHSVLTKGKADFTEVEAALRFARHHIAGPPAD